MRHALRKPGAHSMKEDALSTSRRIIQPVALACALLFSVEAALAQSSGGGSGSGGSSGGSTGSAAGSAGGSVGGGAAGGSPSYSQSPSAGDVVGGGSGGATGGGRSGGNSGEAGRSTGENAAVPGGAAGADRIPETKSRFVTCPDGSRGDLNAGGCLGGK
jgi:hypothetical protein